MRLAEWRKGEGKTQVWLADKLGVTQSYVSTIERATDNELPSKLVLIRIAMLTRFKVLPNDFLPLDELRRQALKDGPLKDGGSKDRAA